MFKTILLSAAAAIAISATAQAQTAALLVGSDTLAHLDTKSMKITKTVKISGAGGPVIGIDVRPADGMLYALAADGTVSTIDPATGKATVKIKLERTLPAGVKASVDFNPVADRMRIIGSDGTSLRANVDDGKVAVDGSLKYADADANKGKAPSVTAGAYSNSVKGAKETALYDIDTATMAYLRQAPPNDGILNTLGKVNVKSKSLAFDIAADGNGGNTGWLLAGRTLYKLDIANGNTTRAGVVRRLNGTVNDLAVLPQS